jgi:PKD repeat protein
MRKFYLALLLILMAISFPSLLQANKLSGKKASTGLVPSYWSLVRNGCAPLSVSLYDMSTTDPADTVVCWKWYFGDGDSSSLKNPSHTYITTGTFDVTMIVRTQSGATDTLTQTGYIHCGNPPVVALGNDTSICSSDILTLNAGNGGCTYSWNTGETSQTIDVNTPGMYIVTVTAGSGCSVSDTINVAVTPTLLPKFGWSYLSSCLPKAVQFKDSSITCGVTIVEWFWDFGDGNTVYGQNPIHTYTSAGSYIAKLRVKDNTGTTITRSKTIVISGSAAPVVALGNDTAICSSNTLTLDAGNAGASYLWSTGETSQTIDVNTPGSYSVMVTVGTGCSSSDTMHVAVTPSLLPKFNWMFLTNCLPQLVQFIDSSITCGVSITEWSWDFGDGTSSTDQEPLHSYDSNGSYIVKLKVKDNTGTTITRSKTIVINTLTPVVNLGKDTSVCDGTIVTLDAGTHVGCSYYWSTGETTQSIQADVTGDYWVQVYNASCSAVDTVHVTVNPQLFPNFSYSQAGTCLPVTVQFTDLSQTCSVSVVYWKWDFGDGTISNLPSPAHVYTAGGSYIVRLTVRDNTGLQITRSKTVIINTNSPLVNLGNDTTICFGNTLTLNAGILGDSYLWSNGSTAQTLDISDAGTYWVQVFKGGCSGWDSITVNTTFPMSPDLGANITSKCLPVLVHFTDSSSIICGVYPINYWKWDFGDGNSSSLQNPDHTYLQAGKFTVRLTIRNSQGIEISKNKQIDIETTGPVSSMFTGVTICMGATAQLDAGNPGAVYSWTPAGALTNAVIQNPVAFPRVTTLFQATVTQCGVTIKDSILVYVDSIAKPKITQMDGGVLVASAALSYQWYHEGEIIETATGRNYKPSGTGNYQVEVTNERGCHGMSDKYFFLPDGGHSLPGTKVKIKVSPNPCHGVITILLSKVPEQPVHVVIHDVYGRKVYQGTINSNVNTINLGHLRKGEYFVELFLNDQKVIIPILIL